MADILYAASEGVARITIDYTERLNALNRRMRAAWPAVLQRFNDDREVRVGILTGAGERAFSTGVDLKEAAARNASGKSGGESGTMPVLPQKPLIAAINGYCLAGGMELALLCDLRIASAGARFGLSEARRGLIPVHAVNLLPRLVAHAEAAYLLLTGDSIAASEACRIGLVHKVLPDAQALEEEARRLAQSILLGAPLAITAIRELLSKALSLPPEELGPHVLARYRELLSTEDAKEGPRAFAEKRVPTWQGK